MILVAGHRCGAVVQHYSGRVSPFCRRDSRRPVIPSERRWSRPRLPRPCGARPPFPGRGPWRSRRPCRGWCPCGPAAGKRPGCSILCRLSPPRPLSPGHRRRRGEGIRDRAPAAGGQARSENMEGLILRHRPSLPSLARDASSRSTGSSMIPGTISLPRQARPRGHNVLLDEVVQLLHHQKAGDASGKLPDQGIGEGVQHPQLEHAGFLARPPTRIGRRWKR